jgi:hypothetical protein
MQLRSLFGRVVILLVAIVWGLVAAGPLRAGAMLLVASYDATQPENSQILSYDLKTGTYLGVYANVPSIQGLTTHQGSVFAVSSSLGEVWKIGSNGSHQVVAQGLSAPDQAVFGPNGNLFVSERFNGVIKEFSGNGTLASTLPADSRLSGFTGFAFGPDSNIYAPLFNYDSNHNQGVLKFDFVANSWGAELFATNPASRDELLSNAAITFGPDGNMYVSGLNTGIDQNSSYKGSVWKFNGTTGASMGAFVPFGTGGSIPLNGADYSLWHNGLFYLSNQGGSVKRFTSEGTGNGLFGTTDFTEPGHGLLTAKGLAVIPEPGSATLLTLGGIALLGVWFQRCRHRLQPLRRSADCTWAAQTCFTGFAHCEPQQIRIREAQ